MYIPFFLYYLSFFYYFVITLPFCITLPCHYQTPIFTPCFSPVFLRVSPEIRIITRYIRSYYPTEVFTVVEIRVGIPCTVKRVVRYLRQRSQEVPPTEALNETWYLMSSLIRLSNNPYPEISEPLKTKVGKSQTDDTQSPT